MLSFGSYYQFSTGFQNSWHFNSQEPKESNRLVLRLLLSELAETKMITLSGAYCTCYMFVSKLEKTSSKKLKEKNSLFFKNNLN
jgi:hypothetical protein